MGRRDPSGVYGPLFRNMLRDIYFMTFVSAHIFIDICHHDTCSRDRCFATDISRHLLPKIFFSLISSTGRLDNDVIFLPFSFPLLLQKITSLSSLPVELIKEKQFWVTSVAKYLTRNICRGNNCHKTFVGVTFVLKQL